MATLSRKILQMMAAILSAFGSAQAATPRVELPTLSKLFGQLREDAALRDRFSRDPRAVFDETGIDPAHYDLPDRLDEDAVNRFLESWAGLMGPAAGARPTAAVTLVSEDSSEVLKTAANEQEPASGPPVATPSDPRGPGDEEKAPAPEPRQRRAPGDAQQSPYRWPSSGPIHTVIYGPPPGHRTKP